MRAAPIILLLATAFSHGIVAQTESTPNPSDLPPSEFTRCGQTFLQIWLDVIFVVDTSSAMGANGGDNVIAFVQGLLYQITPGSGKFQMQTGIITYDTMANVTNEFGSITSYDVVDNINIQTTNHPETNLEDAIRLAQNQFDSHPQTGRAAKRVIVVLASTYKAGSGNDPKLIANGFKDSGGIIITLDYVQVDGLPEPLLAEIASTGYSFTNQQDASGQSSFTFTDMLIKLTHANCFCQTQLKGYTDQTDETPDGGCYDPVTLPTVFRAANNNCKRKSYGLAKITSNNKAVFIAAYYPPRSKIWIGLQYDTTVGDWVWSYDNSRLSGYTNWAAGQPNRGQGDCVYMYPTGFNYQWYTANCMTVSYDYACETNPCNTDLYCAA